MILLSVPLTLLLLKNNLIPLHQSSNLDRLPLNHPGSGTMFFSNPAWTFSLTAAAMIACATDISVSVCSYSSVEASSLICKDPNHSDNASISFVLLELILFSRQVMLSHFVCFFPTDNAVSFHLFCFSTDNAVLLHLSCKVSSSTLYQM